MHVRDVRQNSVICLMANFHCRLMIKSHYFYNSLYETICIVLSCVKYDSMLAWFPLSFKNKKYNIERYAVNYNIFKNYGTVGKISLMLT